MIRGIVNARLEAVVSLRLRGPQSLETTLEAIVDSGFTASLTLPADVVSALGLVRQASSRAILADGSACPFDLFAAEVEWEGAWRPILVSTVGNEALIGMGLLADHQICIEVRPGGGVEIARLS